MEMLGKILVEGFKYRIVWKTPQQKYPRESIMLFVGMEGEAPLDSYRFSARPVAGTQTLDQHLVRLVQSVEQVPAGTPCVLNRILKEGA